MPQWTDIGPADDFPVGAQSCLTADQTHLVVFNVDGDLHCIANVCPHAGLPLGDGERRGLTITCPYHGYTYNIKNGADIDDPEYGEPVNVYPVRIEDGRVQVALQ